MSDPWSLPGHIVLGRDANRVHLLPHPGLRPFISHYTICTPSGPGRDFATAEQLFILPDACGCIVCTFFADELKLLYWGPSSRAVGLENDLEVIPLRFFVEFKHCGAFSILNRSLEELRDARAPLEDLDRPLAVEIRTRFEQAGPDLARAIHSLNQLFLTRLRGEFPRLAHYLLENLAASHGTISVKELATKSGYSARHLNRVSSRQLGLNLKLAARIFRINRAAVLLNLNPHRSLTELAHALHYHDQAHFIHDFTDICGLPPGGYQKAMSAFYNEGLKFQSSDQQRRLS